MIEDYQGDSGEDKSRNAVGRGKSLLHLLFFLFYVVLVSYLIISRGPAMKQALKASDFPGAFRGIFSGESETYPATLYYVKFLNSGAYSLCPYDVDVSFTGESPFHDALEALFVDVPESVLGDGAINTIPSGTRLEGFSVSNGVAFAALSEEFRSGLEASPEYAVPAREQILLTLERLDPSIDRLVVLVGGEVL